MEAGQFTMGLGSRLDQNHIARLGLDDEEIVDAEQLPLVVAASLPGPLSVGCPDTLKNPIGKPVEVAVVESDVGELRLQAPLRPPRFLDSPCAVGCGSIGARDIKRGGTDAIALGDKDPLRTDHHRLGAGGIGVAVSRPRETPRLGMVGRIEADHLRLSDRDQERLATDGQQTRAHITDLVVAGRPAPLTRVSRVGDQRHRPIGPRLSPPRPPPRYDNDVVEEQRRSGASPGDGSLVAGWIDPQISDDVLFPEHLTGGSGDGMEPAGGPGGVDDSVADRRRRPRANAAEHRLVAAGHRHLPAWFASGQRQAGDDLVVAALFKGHGMIPLGGKAAPAGADRPPPEFPGRTIGPSRIDRRSDRIWNRCVSSGPEESRKIL